MAASRQELDTGNTNADVASPASGMPAWHAIEVADVHRHLGSRDEGIGSREAEERLARNGPNKLPEPPRRGPLRRFLAQFESLLIQVLLGAAVITAFLGHVTDTLVILAVCLLNAAIGFVQEGRAEQALAAIRHMLSAKATVLRDGRRQTVPAEALVPGDLVLLEAGDRTPADLRIVYARNLHAEEAALTGESAPVEKRPDPAAPDAPLGDRASMAFSGTLITHGQGRGIVVATGVDTEIGRISGMMARLETLETPLLRQMSRFARVLTTIVLAAAALVFALGLFLHDYPASELFMAIVSLAVAAIPEGLPAILTITLAIGVQAMARRNAIVRRLPAVETLGSVSVICTDKTGTLTRNEMTVGAVATADGGVAVGGVGYAPHGGFSREERDLRPDEIPLVVEIARAGALCNDAVLHESEAGWRVEGDPMEGALLTLAHKAGLDPAEEGARLPRTDLIPFDSAHRFMATLHHDHEGRGVVYVKGAPERLLEMCAQERRADGDVQIDAAAWQAQVEALAAQGRRVIAVATRPGHEGGALTFADVEAGLVLLGLVGLIDPPREEAIAAVAACREAGIRVKMITGDHAVTARAIARELGLENASVALTGAEIETLDDAELRRHAPQVDVFARASPEHKLRLVEALQANGFSVAMTGDGVNDAPALKRADVGVAMGEKGTEAAKEAAEIVLADDNFASIAAAVREGRTVYDNLKKAILFLLPVNGGEALSVVVAILAGLTLPITPLQILWVNMVSSVGLALALAFEPAEPDVMRRQPRPASEPLLTRFLAWRVAFVSVLMMLGIFGLFEWAVAQGADVDTARTVAVNTLVCMEVFYLFSVRFLHAPSLTWRGVLGTRAVLVAIAVVVLLQLVFTYAPFMNAVFATRPLGIVEGIATVGAGVLLFAALEVEKAIGRRAKER